MKLRYLIVMPKIVNKVGDWYSFPLGIAYISSQLKLDGFSVWTLNLNHTSGNTESVLKKCIVENKIDVVLTGGLTGQYGAIFDILVNVNGIRSQIKTVVGGGIITSDPVNAMKALDLVDYGVIGEGEYIVSDLCYALENNGDVSSVPGLVLGKNDNYFITEGNVKSVDIENLPFPDYSGFEIQKLLKSAPNMLGMTEAYTLPITTSRSCPYRCTFCFHSSGSKYRQRSLDSVFSEIEFLIEEYGLKYLSIVDELFSHDKARLYEFCERIKKYNVKWWAEFNLADINQKTVSYLVESNCSALGFGVESADNRVLKSMRKNIKIEQTEKALQQVYDAGIGIAGCFIFGDVSETIETATNTLNWWKKNIHFDLQLSLIVTYPGTELYKYAIKNNLIDDPVKFIKDGCPVINLSKMSKEEYLWLLGQVLTLPRMSLNKPANLLVEKINFVNGNIDVVGNCVSCGATNKWDTVRLFVLDALSCKTCGQRHRSPIPDLLVENVSTNIDLLVKKYGDVAIWGINSYIYDFSSRLKLNDSDKVHFIDKSEIRHGLSVGNFKVESPNIINNKNIKCIVVAVVQYYSNLEIQLKEEFPNIEKLISITELLSRKEY